MSRPQVLASVVPSSIFIAPNSLSTKTWKFEQGL